MTELILKSLFFLLSASDPQLGIRQKYQGKKRDEGWGVYWDMWIIGASLHWRWLKDHMLLNAFSALFPSQRGDFSETHFSSSNFTTLMNNASDAAENSFILAMCSKIMANSFPQKKRKKKKRKSHGLLNFD